MTSMRAVQVKEQGGELELVEREVPQPGRGVALVRVHACGICHSDSFAITGGFPGITWPHVPGHEIAGEVAALGEDVKGWEVGQRVGVGWFGGGCGHCHECRRGDLINCENLDIPGITIDGGYADYVLVKAGALAAIPDELADEDAAPLLCAGITTYNALRPAAPTRATWWRSWGWAAWGTSACSTPPSSASTRWRSPAGARRRSWRASSARATTSTAAPRIPRPSWASWGAPRVILSTITNAPAVTAVLGGLGVRGKLVVVGASMEPMEIPPAMLIGGSKTIAGHASGHSGDSEDALSFSALSGVRPMIETFPLEQAAQAYERMMSGEARFRMVLTTGA